MEFYKDDQNSTHYTPNFVSNQNTNGFPNPLSFSHPTLESAFSSLNLLPENSPAPSVHSFAGEYMLSPRRMIPSNDVSLQSLRFQEGQMGSGVALPNLMGPQIFNTNTPPAPAPAPAQALFGGGPSSSRVGGLDFLVTKKQSTPHYLNTQMLTQVPSYLHILDNRYVDFDNLNDGLPQMRSSLTLDDIRGSIIFLAKDQHCCKILLEKLLDATPHEFEMIFTEVMDSICDLMRNQFGSYFVKRLIGSCNETQKTRIILSVTKSMFEFIAVCCNPHGTRAMQILIDCVSSSHQVSLLMAAISPNATILANDTNGHHVIQHCLKQFPDVYNMHILNNIASNCFEVATSRTGCCVIQSCVEKSVGKPRQHLVSEIIATAVHLAEHPFGNYVMQHMLGLKEEDITACIVKQLQGSYVSISCNKYGSNVVEKCLTESSAEQCTRIIMELVGSPKAYILLFDPYGNFVIQSALSVSKGQARNALLQLVQTYASLMQSNIYGKKILALLERRRLIRLI